MSETGKVKRERTKPASSAPYVKKNDAENPLFERRPRNYGIGLDIQPAKDLGRYVKWPRYVRVQRQRQILFQRLKVPAAIAQFLTTLDKNTAVSLFKFLNKYRPEDSVAKKQRLQKTAEAKAASKELDEAKKPYVVKFGLNHVTKLVEDKKAKLVIIAHDVDPIELVLWLPALCIKMQVPYVIVKGKSRLGQVVRQKNATALAVVDVRNADKAEFQSLLKAVDSNYTATTQTTRTRRREPILGMKSQHKVEAHERQVAREAASKARNR
jgi:large subunit ribosomal protein L7Ae